MKVKRLIRYFEFRDQVYKKKKNLRTKLVIPQYIYTHTLLIERILLFDHFFGSLVVRSQDWQMQRMDKGRKQWLRI